MSNEATVEAELRSGSIETERRFSQGAVVPLSALLTFDSGNRFGAYRPFEIFPYFGALNEALTAKKGTIIRGSAVADIAEIVRTGDSSRAFLKRLIPWRFAEEIRKISEIGRGKTAGAEEKTNFALVSHFLAGPDFDGRMALGIGDFYLWRHRFWERAKESLPIASFEETNRGQTITMTLDGIIAGWDRGNLAVGGDNISHTPIAQVTVGEWWNHIPFCDFRILAQSHAYLDTKIPLASFCVAPRGDFLPPKLQRRDTRSDPRRVNSYDLVCGELHRSLTTLPEEFAKGRLPALGKNRYLRPHELQITPAGLVYPALGGNWLKTDTGEINHIVVLGNAQILDPLLYLPPTALTVLSEPIRFGEGFGEAESPPDTFVEFLRVLRKAGRYGKIAEDKRTENAFAIIRGEKRIGGRRFYELLKEKTGEREEWQFEATRELATALFYAPRELIENGNLAGFEQYCPNWKLIADLAGSLPDRNTTLGNLRADAALQTREAVDGWRLIAKSVREKAKKDAPLAAEISRKNDLELVFWLLTVRL